MDEVQFHTHEERAGVGAKFGSLGERAAFWSLSQGMLCAGLRVRFCAVGLGIPQEPHFLCQMLSVG